MKKILFVMLFGFIILFMNGCGYTEEQKAEMEKLEKQASTNAVNYIQNKYGFNAKVLDVTLELKNMDPYPIINRPPTGYGYVTLTDGKEEFLVYISGENENTDGKDDYQYVNLAKQYINIINSRLNLKMKDYIIYSREEDLYSELLSDEQLKNYLNDKIINIEINYINQGNLEYIKANNILSDLNNVNVELTNYYSIDDYKFVQEQLFDDKNNRQNFGTNIESFYARYNNSDYAGKYNFKKIDDILYNNYSENSDYEYGVFAVSAVYIHPNTKYRTGLLADTCFEDCLGNTSNVELMHTTMPSIDNWYGKGIDKYDKIEVISEPYLVQGQYNNLMVYFPKNILKRLKINEDANISLALYCDNEYKKSYPLKDAGRYQAIDLGEYCSGNTETKFEFIYKK